MKKSIFLFAALAMIVGSIAVSKTAKATGDYGSGNCYYYNNDCFPSPLANCQCYK